MKTGIITIIITIAFMSEITLFAGSCCSHSSKTDSCGGAKATSSSQAPAISYICPMHPDVKSGNPGKCPKCGMYLEAAPVDVIYWACPMHQEQRSATAGKCTKCGMKLEKKTEKIAYAYTCHMHPEVKSDKPGKCHKCGMFLEAEQKTYLQNKVQEDSQHAH